MGLTDKEIRWKRHKQFIPAALWQNGDNASTIIITRALSTPFNGICWDGSGGSTGYSTTVAVEGLIPVPSNWDPQHPLGFRVHYASHQTSQAITLTMLCQFVSVNAAIAGTASGGLNTVFGAQTVATVGDAYHRSSRGVKNGLWASRAQITAGLYMQWSLAVAASLSTTNWVRVLGLEVDYVPMLTIYPHSELDRPEDDTVS